MTFLSKYVVQNLYIYSILMHDYNTFCNTNFTSLVAQEFICTERILRSLLEFYGNCNFIFLPRIWICLILGSLPWNKKVIFLFFLQNVSNFDVIESRNYDFSFWVFTRKIYIETWNKGFLEGIYTWLEHTDYNIQWNIQDERRNN